MVKWRINKGVVLAAGDGSRLKSVTGISPKVLLPVQGKRIIWYPIEAMAAAGIEQIAVVVGYLADEVTAALGDGSRFGVKLDYILNQEYDGGNAISVSKVKAWAAGESFVLCMGDHIIEPEMVSRLVDKSSIAETLCVDSVPAERHDLAEATKVVVDTSGDITRIGKGLAYWNAIDTGVFLLTKKFLDTIDELSPQLGIHIEMSQVIQFMVSRGDRFATCDVSGCFWKDMDTEEDLEYVTA